jgi:hypothetical protein
MWYNIYIGSRQYRPGGFREKEGEYSMSTSMKTMSVKIKKLDGTTIVNTTRLHISSPDEYDEEKNSQRITAALRRCGVRTGFIENCDGSYYYGRHIDNGFSVDGKFEID